MTTGPCGKGLATGDELAGTEAGGITGVAPVLDAGLKVGFTGEGISIGATWVLPEAVVAGTGIILDSP